MKTCRAPEPPQCRMSHHEKRCKWVRGSGGTTEGPRFTFSSVSALLQIKPPGTPPACHRSSAGSRREEGTNRPGDVSDDEAALLDEADARAGDSGLRLEHCHI